MTDKEKLYKLLNNIVKNRPDIESVWNTNEAKYNVTGLSRHHLNHGYEVSISNSHFLEPDNKYRIYLYEGDKIITGSQGTDNINKIIRFMKSSDELKCLVEGIE